MKAYKQLFLSLFFLSFLLSNAAAAGSEEIIIMGKVTDGKKGIPGIVVSDGYTVTTTDDSGNYQMKKDLLAKFVFISLPENYAVPTQGNVPLFYQSAKAVITRKAVVQADFQLTEIPVKNDFVLFALADPQPNKDWQIERFTNETVAELSTVAEDFPAGTEFMGLVVGDIVWDSPDLYPDYLAAIKKLSFPLFHVIGNHDHDQRVTDDDYHASRVYEQYFGPTYYSFNRGKCHFVVLDDINYSGRKVYKEEITPEQIAWLKKDLEHVSKDKLIIVGLHAPTVYRTGKKLNTSDELYALLDGYNAIFISGHTHRMSRVDVNEHLHDFNLSAVFGDSWSADMSPVGTPNGYGVFKISGNKLVSHYFKGTGHDPAYQMRLYPVGTMEAKKESIIAFIWTWNKKWKIEVFEDDVLKGSMTQFSEIDPLAYDTFFGPEKPERKPKLEPQKTPNLFYYTPVDPQAKIKVVATDEYGNTYSESLP